MSSKRRLRRRSCEGKKYYATVEEAEADARKLRGKFWTSNYRAYGCQFCGGYHVGRPSAKAIKAIRQSQADRARNKY